MKINVTENKVSIKEEQILNENEYNIHKIQFDFSSEYTDDLVKVALFSIDNHTYKKIISNNECDIPPEVLTQRGYSILGVYAYKTEQDTLVLRYSPSPTRISVYDGSYKAEAENSEPITPSEIEQYQQILQNSLQQFQNQYNVLVEETEGDIQAIENELQRKVDEGYFDGEDGFSPIAKVIQKSNGATIEIEDKNGKTTADVLNGEDGYTPVRGVDYWTEEDKQEVEEEAIQQIEGKIEEYNENAAEKLNQYNQNSVQKTNDYNTNAEQKMSAYNTNATEKTSTYNSNATEKFNDYNSNAEQKETNYNTNANNKLSEYNSNAETKKTAYDENATQKTNSFNTNATNKLTEYNTNHTEKMSAYNSNSIQKLNAFNENAIQKTEDFDEHTEEIQESIENLQTENARLKATLPTTTGEGQAITLNKTAELEFKKPPLPMGNSEQDGEPSPDNEVPITNVTGDVEVNVQNKNLNPYPYKDTTKTKNGITFTDNGDGTINVNGTASSITYFDMTSNGSTKGIKLKAGTYNVSIGASSNVRATIAKYSNVSEVVAIIPINTSSTTFTIEEDTEITFVLAINNGLSANNILIKPQIEKGSTSTPYTPHKKQVLPLTLGNIELCKIGNYQDYFYKDSDKWYLHKETHKIVLNGTETGWVYDSTYKYFRNPNYNFGSYIPLLLTSSNKATYETYSNLFKVNKNWSGANSFRDNVNVQGEFYPAQNSGYKVTLRNLDYDNTNDLINWLINNNVYIYYPLETPTYTEITDTTLISQLEAIYNALSYEEQTNISSNQNAIFNVEAYLDTKVILSEKGTYSKPSTGIPKTDLASAVQTSLNKADTALQSHQDITGKEDKTNKVTSIDENSTDEQYPSAKCVNTIKERVSLLENIQSMETMSWEQIQAIVQDGKASTYFKVGDQIETTWKDTATNTTYTIPLDVVSIEDVIIDDNGTEKTVPGMILQFHYCLPFGVQFSQNQAFYYCAETLPAGTYYFTIGNNWGNNVHNGYKYEFTTTVDIPAGGQIQIGTASSETSALPDTNPANWRIRTYSSAESTTPLEILTLTEYTEGTPNGTSLGTLSSSTKYNTTINNMQCSGYGHNSWKNSAVRQFLNSDENIGDWFELPDDDVFARKPNQLSTKNGFLTGVDTDLLAVVKATKIATRKNYHRDDGDWDYTYDKFFIPSLEQAYCVPQVSGEGTYWEYWKQKSELSSPNAQWSTNAKMITYAMENHSSAQTVRLRSALRYDSISTWCISSSGNVYGYSATSASRFSPACVIC